LAFLAQPPPVPRSHRLILSRVSDTWRPPPSGLIIAVRVALYTAGDRAALSLCSNAFRNSDSVCGELETNSVFAEAYAGYCQCARPTCSAYLASICFTYLTLIPAWVRIRGSYAVNHGAAAQMFDSPPRVHSLGGFPKPRLPSCPTVMSWLALGSLKLPRGSGQWVTYLTDP